MIVNAEWWTAGALAVLCGGRLVLGFHVLGLLALAAVVFGVRRLLMQAGLEGRRLVMALVLFATGSGLGWLRVRMGRPGWQVPDVLMGMYPWHQALMNPHFVWGTALLLWSASWYVDYRAGRGPRWRWVLAGAVLGLSRPYDLATFMAVLGALTLADLAARSRRAEAVRHAPDVLWLAPAALYYAALVRGRFGLGGWTGVQSGDLNPPSLEFVWAILPAALAVAVFWALAPRAGNALLHRLVAAWCLVLMAVVCFYPSPMAKQHATSLGTATLLAAGLVVPLRWLAALCAACCPTSLFVLWLVLQPQPGYFVPREYFSAVHTLADACRPRDVLVAPTDLSLMVAGLTPCSVALGHRTLTPAWPAAIQEGRRFYDEAAAVEWRLAYLDRLRARFVALPRGRGAWLGPDGRYRPRLSTPLFELWERAGQGG